MEYSDALGAITPTSILSALALARQGRVYSLDSRWWHGMPILPVHPRFDVMTYRSPHGFRVQKDQAFLQEPQNSVHYGFISELISGTAHSGTHIDALCHVTCGERHEWHGGHSSDEFLGDFGAMNSDAAELRPIIARGVMLDIPRHLGIQHCARSYGIGSDDLSGAAEAQGVEVRKGDVVLVRTGQMQYWPDPEAMYPADLSGVSFDGARWLAEREVIAVGADTVQFECAPSGIEGNPQPCHIHLMQERGIPIMEWVQLEELAREQVYEFLFVCLPLTIAGATGSMVRPIAIV
jgi:kynurenine formamidase